ncbi:MAG: O-antigen ligase family protein [Phycisphaerales bacterium]|nr:O-antigen ligase family protein [Phycisphaerales bacterium]
MSAKRVEEIFLHQRTHDRLGYRIHVAAAALFLFLLPFPTSISEFAVAPLLITVLIRLPGIYKLIAPIGGFAVARLAVAWGAWVGLSWFWMIDAEGWKDEASYLRWALLVPLLWPVLDRRQLLLLALLAGCVFGNASQLAQVIEGCIGADWLPWNRMPGRTSGWWDPVVGGSLLCAALGAHLGLALLARGRWRVVGASGALLSAAAIIATGTRGAWIAAAILIPAAMLVAIARALPSRKFAGQLPLFVAAAALLTISLWPVVAPVVRPRAKAGIDEVRAAIKSGDFTTDTGARVQMWVLAGEAMKEHPARGVGAGSYRRWVQGYLRQSGVDAATRSVHAHAHGIVPHIGSTLGAVGLLIMGAMCAWAMWSTLSAPLGGDRTLPAQALGVDAACGLALAGLLLAGLFDTVHVNSQTAAMLWALVALCQTRRPAIAVLRGLGV